MDLALLYYAQKTQEQKLDVVLCQTSGSFMAVVLCS